MRSGRRTGLFDFRLGSDIHVLIGCGLGGGSLINAAVGLRPDARVFADAAWPGEVREDGLLDQGFARARTMLRPTRYAKASDLTKYRALEAASACFGQAPVAAPVVVSFEATVNPAGVEQPACTLCGDCCSGCNVGAKNTVALTYLPDAKAHGAEIFTELTVSHVEKVDSHWRVHFAPTEEPDAPCARSRPRPWCCPPARSARPRSCSARAKRGCRSPTVSASASPPMATSSPLRSAARGA